MLKGSFTLSAQTPFKQYEISQLVRAENDRKDEDQVLRKAEAYVEQDLKKDKSSASSCSSCQQYLMLQGWS